MGCCDTVPRYWMSDPPARIMNIKHHENPATGLAPVSWTLYWCYWGPLTSLHRLGLSPPSCRHSPTCIGPQKRDFPARGPQESSRDCPHRSPPALPKPELPRFPKRLGLHCRELTYG